jgi:hypothetical protein
MPFTFSHPAAIFPFRLLPDRYYSMTGLIAGSLTPDFEYFIRMNVKSIYSHTLSGLFYFDIPIGIAISFIFHDLIRNDLIDHLPAQLRRRFFNLKEFKWNCAFKHYWYIIILSIGIGAASHILWDGFTHPLGFFVNKYPLLQHKFQIKSYSIPAYNILQNLSSLIGGIAVLIFIRNIPLVSTDASTKKDMYWTLIIITVLVVMLLRFSNGLTLAKYGNVTVSLISAFFIALICTSSFFKTYIGTRGQEN